MMLWLTHRLSLAQLLSRPELVAAEATALLAQFEAMPSSIPFTTWLLAGCGRHEEALERLRQTRLDPVEIPSADLSNLMGAAEAAVVLGEREIGERLYPRVVEAADRMLWNLGPGALLGPTARVLGDLARCIGRTAEALRHYDEAVAFAEKLGSPPLIELCRRARQVVLDSAPVREPAPEARLLPSAVRQPLLRQDGELWAVLKADGTVLRLKPSKGLAYLHQLMQQPGRPLHVLELAGIEHYTGDAGVVLDPRAKLEYRQRLVDLREALAEAESFGDPARAGEVQREIDALAEQLAQAVGLGGRDRRAASDVERTRVNIQRRLKDAIERIARADAATGRYLAATIETGTYCVYRPL